MNLSRRGFFGLLGASGAAAAALPPAATATSAPAATLIALDGPGISGQGKAYQEAFNEAEREYRIITRAMRLLGIISAGQCPAASNYEAAKVALNQILDDLYSRVGPDPTELEVTHKLAAELGPEYGLLASKEGIRFYRDAMTMVWPAVGK